MKKGNGAADALPFLFVVACALFNDKGEILLTRRPKGKNFAGLWEFPGGKCEKGELPETALIRELKEELNIDIVSSDLHPLSFASYAYVDFHLFMPLYKCAHYQGEIRAMEEQDYIFLKPKEIKNYSLVPADIGFLPLFEAL